MGGGDGDLDLDLDLDLDVYQVREFSHLHSLLSFLILSCDLSPFSDTKPKPGSINPIQEISEI